MRTGEGVVHEVFYDKNTAARILCPNALIPSPGQYLLAEVKSDPATLLPVPVFPAGSADGGFLAASPFPEIWHPGTSLTLRGPLGNGFSLPSSARSVALAAYGETTQRLAAIIESALSQGAAVTLLSAHPPTGLPNAVEVMQLGSLPEVLRWADYVALDMPRENLGILSDSFNSKVISGKVQILLTSPMPCGGRGDCGVCAVTVKRGYKLICKDGPVFDLNLFL